jgi:hypothetical protein
MEVRHVPAEVSDDPGRSHDDADLHQQPRQPVPVKDHRARFD